MNFEQIINNGLSRAELISASIVYKTEDSRDVLLKIRELTIPAKIDLFLPFDAGVETADESLAYLALREANEYLEDLRNED